MNKISVALCTYNGAEFLGEQLNSYLAQTRQPDELIVGDDCSSDATAKIVSDFARRAPFPVELEINERNLGSTENFALTMARCRGDIIFLSDQDDVWLSQKIEALEAELVKFPNVGLVFSDAEIVDENLAPLNRRLSDYTFSKRIRRATRSEPFLGFLLSKNYVTGATLAFRTRFRDEILPFPTDIPEMIHDAWTAFVVVANADFRFIDEVLVKYRQHAGQQLGVFVENEFENLSRRERYAKTIEIHRGEKARVEKILRQVRARPQSFVRRDLIEEAAAREANKIDRRIQHYEARKNLPRPKIKRIAPIFRELASGRYQEVSKGFLSAAKDLFGAV